MKCQACQAQLSAYLDGELGDREASALRGHLRTCAACREQSAAEAAVIDSLRQLPPLDPPPALWQAIRGQLAHEEIADARAPLHQRLWRKLAPWAAHGVGGLAVATAAVGLLWWSSRTPSASRVEPVVAPVTQPVTVEAVAALPAPGEVVDVATALGDEVAMIDRSYSDAVSELVSMIGEARPAWTASYGKRYDERVRVLRARVDSEKSGKAKERAWQELMRFLQTTLTRSELAMGAP